MVYLTYCIKPKCPSLNFLYIYTSQWLVIVQLGTQILMSNHLGLSSEDCEQGKYI